MQMQNDLDTVIENIRKGPRNLNTVEFPNKFEAISIEQIQYISVFY